MNHYTQDIEIETSFDQYVKQLPKERQDEINEEMDTAIDSD